MTNTPTMPAAAPAAPGAAAKPTLEEPLFSEYVNFIYELSGIRFTANKAYFLASKLENRRRALNLPDLRSYLTFIKGPQAKMHEHNLLMNEVTINETFFFRNEPQLKVFEEEILKPLLEEKRRKGDLTFRFWSAASSTGDEAYTMALQLLNMGLRDFRVELMGTDISQHAVDLAHKGVYSKYAVRNIPPHMMQRFFKPVDEHTFALDDSIKRMAKFQVMNLMDRARIRGLGKFDAVFCRNVLIYFDEKSREQVLENIYDQLHDHGVLLMGHSENLYSHRHLFKLDKDRPIALAYSKMPPGTAKLNV